VTTIATDGKTMAGDGRTCRDDLVTSEVSVKIHRLADGSLFGGAGISHETRALRDWLDKGGEGSPPKAKDLAALVLKPNGELWYYCNDSAPSLTSAPNAVGTGEQLAIGAMEAGASPERAVEIASRRDVHSGGKVTSLSLGRVLKAA
jgi:hypothetical protein